jgi:RimJ/RimL family protein N-acetyltransferase
VPRRDFPLLVKDGDVRFERWRVDRHTHGLAAACADPEVMRFLGGRGMTASESRDVSRKIEEHWERERFGLWAVVIEGETVGFAGACVPYWHPEYAGEVEVGWRLARSAWGRGLATRGGRAGIDAAFEHLGLERVIAFVHPENHRSLAVTTRLGMTEVTTTIDPRLGARLQVLEVVRPAG